MMADMVAPPPAGLHRNVAARQPGEVKHQRCATATQAPLGHTPTLVERHHMDRIVAQIETNGFNGYGSPPPFAFDLLHH
jgi:hypothetical protein